MFRFCNLDTRLVVIITIIINIIIIIITTVIHASLIQPIFTPSSSLIFAHPLLLPLCPPLHTPLPHFQYIHLGNLCRLHPERMAVPLMIVFIYHNSIFPFLTVLANHDLPLRNISISSSSFLFIVQFVFLSIKSLLIISLQLHNKFDTSPTQKSKIYIF